ncbi:MULTISPECIES: tripartite tricarboxylate transporter substrate binding protein [unclassified Variovorax]|uniref:Bug family tripartite tricarboxylate transporter substrate binding protein n=1 Tax=unclassified Variovorax TaxID=663243 RepID=UPI00257511D5|nr:MULTISPECIES: tripartite tricarboxylate transporter substrate binding protein [unclassified Variovorax]MDM0087964.1 tripartite tricarboxylate transporter substrate binding protein [Variovorax sp. J22G40]MDM0146037.1 tripartite tricarboxylate transporter substrate binding protein [Variovorax sp. J2P1-31]
MSSPILFRRACIVALSLLATLLEPSAVYAADYPSRPIKIIVAMGPGGLSDLTTRQLARMLEAKLGQPVIVENKPSAGQVVGMQATANAAPDGYTLLLGSTTGLAITPKLFNNVTIDPTKFVAVSPISTTPNVLVALPDFPANDFKELAANANARKDPITYGSIGVGTSPHLGMEIFRIGAKFEATHVPYKGDAPALLALKSREVDTAVITMFSAQPRIKSGELKALGVFQAQPFQNLPNIQTTTQAGVPEADVPGWVGLFASPGTPTSIIAKLEPVARQVIASAEFQAFLASHGSESVQLDNKSYVAMIARQSAQLGDIIKKLNLQSGQ